MVGQESTLCTNEAEKTKSASLPAHAPAQLKLKQKPRKQEAVHTEVNTHVPDNVVFLAGALAILQALQVHRNTYSKLRIGHTEQCPCGTGSQTTEHLLQSSQIYEPLRKGIWPDDTPVALKLYGSLGDLRCTATFIEETGVSI